ncbi:hypothetical protein, conserved [Leishmania tarentolae]|uniref:Transmembrane protein n=1 Tax=Leishmania tarentolae TaxID=5689 RepID=A0A640KPM7_LEITA|nr:hypothetical protein, conserved [Leishmania tarentolae]
MKSNSLGGGVNGSFYYHSRSKQDEGSYEVSNGDGYTAEMVTDTNAPATEQTQAENEMVVSVPNTYDYGNYYDPSLYQSYYYQDDEGNYYYYADPHEALSTEAPQGLHSSVTPTPQNLIRSYEYASYDPPTYNWFADIVVDTFLSAPFRVYLTILLYCAATLIAALGLNYTFALLYRLFAPPIPNTNKNMQSFAYFSTFFYLSFVIVALLCALMDMVRNLWTLNRSDVLFWGISHRYISKRTPPYLVYLAIVLVTVFLPLLWGIMEAAVQKQSLVYVAQRYATVAVLAALFLVIVCCAWLYWRALAYKWLAIQNRSKQDDFELRRRAYKAHPEKMNKVHWYHASTVLEEFGMDGNTLLYNSIVFTVGCVPLFSLYAAQTLSTYSGTPSLAWPAVASVSIACVYIVSWMTFLRRKSKWATYTSCALIVLLLVLGIVGGAVGGQPSTTGVVVLLFFASQGMVLRKRKHSLTKKELRATLKLPNTEQTEDDAPHERRIDTYLFCCRSVILDYLKCCDVKKYFGYRHPDVVEAERRFMINRMALRTDQKALLIWWVIVMFAVAFVMALSKSTQYRFTTPIAVSTGTPETGLTPSTPVCETVFNVNGSAPLKMLDLALLAALSYTYGANGDTDFATWFSSKPSLLRIHPVALPYTLNFNTDGTNISFSHYVDVSSKYHVITLNSNNRGLSLFRDLDDWGESIALQAAGSISPLINIWDEHNRAAFVQKARFLKNWLPKSTALDDVKKYIAALKKTGDSIDILIVGDQFNGGYAKRLSAELHLPFVAFNPPGTKYIDVFLTNGTQLSGVRSLWSYVDSLEDTVNTVYYPCKANLSSNTCGRISSVIEYLLTTCGDPTGRSMNRV